MLPQVEDFKNLWVLSEGKVEREIKRHLMAVSVVYWSTVGKRELFREVKCLIYWSVYVANLTDGHELWVGRERMLGSLA